MQYTSAKKLGLPKRIILPNKLDLLGSINFCSILDGITDEELCYFDFGRLGRVEPFGMLFTGAKFRQNKRKYPNLERKAENFQEGNCAYAANMGYFKSIGLDYGKNPGEASGSNNYIPVTKLEKKHIVDESSKEAEHIGNIVEKRAESLAKVLSRGKSTLTDHLTYSIRELIRNVVEHSQAECIWYAGQCWPTYDIVEIAILDEGIGIKNSLIKNPIYKSIIQNDEDALLYAIKPGVTSAFGKKDPYDEWANSGYGLYVTSQLCAQGGDFFICSNEKALYIDNNGIKTYNVSINGTAIRMRLRISRIKDLSVPKIVKEGEKLAKEMKSAVKTASKVSSILRVSKQTKE